MQNLFLVDGASGAGKSDLLRWVVDNNAQNIAYLQKFTTRSERPQERSDPNILLDLQFIDEEVFNNSNFEYKYAYGGALYGFNASALTNLLMDNDNVFAIIRNTSLIEKILDDYKLVNTIPLFIYTDRDALVNRMKAGNFSHDQIEFRLARSELALRDYYSRPEFYQETIVNNSNQNVFHTTVDRILQKYKHYPRIDPNLILVMMSYNPENKKLDDYFDAMEFAVREISTSMRCHRIDSVPGSIKISTEFREMVANSRCVIVDLTENKPNVYYELGFLHAIEKRIIITAEIDTPVTFYPSEYKILYYASARELREKLVAELRGLIVDLPGL